MRTMGHEEHKYIITFIRALNELEQEGIRLDEENKRELIALYIKHVSISLKEQLQGRAK